MNSFKVITDKFARLTGYKQLRRFIEHDFIEYSIITVLTCTYNHDNMTLFLVKLKNKKKARHQRSKSDNI